MNEQGVTYKCPRKCPIKKHCFVIKLPEELTSPLPVFQKCPAEKGDIRITIGPERSP